MNSLRNKNKQKKAGENSPEKLSATGKGLNRLDPNKMKV